MNFDPSSSDDLLRLTLYLTPDHECGYFKDRPAATLYVDPDYEMNMRTYQFLLYQGFRRSGDQVYRPYCRDCHECIPIRLPVEKFKLSKSLRRVWKKNQDLTVTASPPSITQERFELYQNYINNRHEDGPMANPTPDDFLSFLDCSWGKTQFVEFRLDTKLLMVAVIDCLEDGLSAVYTFFDPAFSSRSLGTYAILWEVKEAQSLGNKWLYLGYWVEGCKKMRYKSRFKPMQIYQERKWVEYDLAVPDIAVLKAKKFG
ncbi:MAG: arginyltransferase [Magnetococcales bacterium]|nr:arginyltransferase [Magnetococcales bacterium]